MTEKLSFAISDAQLVEEDPNSSFSILSLDFFASGDNLHDLYISKDTLLEKADTIKNCPVVWKYDDIMQDAESHNSEEVPCGFVPESAKITSRELSDGRTMLTTISYVWKKYSGKILEFFKRDGEKPISVEMSVFDQKKNDNGKDELLDYKFEAVTVLGNMIRPAIPLAHATVLQFAKEYQEDYNREFVFSNKYSNIDFIIPKKIKDSAKKSLDSYREKGTNATSMSLAMGRFLMNNEKITPEKVKLMAKFFNRKVQYDDVTIGFFGGKEGFKWSKDIMSKIEEIDNKQLSYFGEGETVTFPYKSITEAPPSIQKLDDIPLTAEQASEIAAQADKIGGEYAWPTAIKSWKSRHTIKNGHWVKKESMSEKEETFVENEEKELEKKEEIKEEMAEEIIPESEKEPEKEEMAVEKKDEDEKSEKEEEKSEAEEEAKEEVEEKKEIKEEKMSLDANLDVAAYLAFLEATTEANEEMVAKYKTGEEFDYAKIFTASKEKMCKMAEELDKAKEDNDAYMSMKEEFEALKQFKAETQSAQVAYAVESTIAEASDVLPKEKVEEFRGRAKDYTVDTVSGLTNEIKAFAFSCSKDKKPNDGITRFDTGWVTTKKSDSYENGWV